VSRPSHGRGMVPVSIWTQASTALGDFVTLRLIRGCALGQLDASALGGKTSSPYGKVRGLPEISLGKPLGIITVTYFSQADVDNKLTALKY